MVKNSRNSEGIFAPFPSRDVPWESHTNAKGVVSKFQLLGQFGGGNQIGVGIDILEPRQYSNEFHYHLTEEEHVLILEGEATLYLADKAYVMREGDYCCFPAGQPAGHHLYNHTDKTCRFLTIGDNKPTDLYFYPKLKTARVKGQKQNLKLD